MHKDVSRLRVRRKDVIGVPMEKRTKTKRILLPVCIIGGVLLCVLLFAAGRTLSINRICRTALETSEQAPYTEAKAALEQTIETLNGKWGTDRKIFELQEKSDALDAAEIKRAIDAKELDYAAELLQKLDRERYAKLYEESAYRIADTLERMGDDRDALSAFLALGTVRDAQQRAAAIQERLDFLAAQGVFTGSNFDEAIAALYALGTENGEQAAKQLEKQKAALKNELRKKAQGRIGAGAWHTAAIGITPWIAGDKRYSDAPEAADRIVSGLTSLLFLQDGKVICAGETYGAAEEIASYTDVVDAASGLNHALFLHADGTVSGVGSRAFGRLETADWTEIVSVAAGAWHSAAVRADGTVLACGGNEKGQCEVSAWSDVAFVSAGLWHTVGLKTDGTAVACGDNTYGQCDVSDWTDLVAIVCGACHTVGLKSDGTVVACGDNAAGQCAVSTWTDAAAIAAGAYHTVAVRLDGSTVSAGLLPQALPEEPLFDSIWTCETIEQPEPEHAEAKPYIEGEDADYGPWLYLDPYGAVLICIDDSEPHMPFRADLLATKNALPGGRVTNPEATGTVIRMETELPYEQAQKHRAVLAFTGDYIGFTANRKGVMIRNGIVYYDRSETNTLAILPDGTLKVYQKGEINAKQLLQMGVRDSFSFGPVLVENGKSVADPKSDTVTMRVVFGYGDPYHYIVAVAERDRALQMTYTMVAQVCENYGCRTAYNLDGGHSTSLAFLGRELSLISLTDGRPHHNYRALSDIIVFLTYAGAGAN